MTIQKFCSFLANSVEAAALLVCTAHDCGGGAVVAHLVSEVQLGRDSNLNPDRLGHKVSQARPRDFYKCVL